MPRACSTWAVSQSTRIASDALGGRVVHLVTADERASAYPRCEPSSQCQSRGWSARGRATFFTLQGFYG